MHDFRQIETIIQTLKRIISSMKRYRVSEEDIENIRQTVS